nr:MAG TPA: Radical SAM superfamily [Caudoviricetes sp.]
MIARVFPRRTAMSPTDALASFGPPTIENIADCIKAGVTEVHISVTFTWDLEKAEDLYYAWQILGVPVEVGGPAFDDRMGNFTPGLYLREGMIFTSRGCTKDCWFCSVPRCAHGEIKELPIVDGWNILDDNILATSEQHFRAVCAMLKRQKHPAVFSGGLHADLLCNDRCGGRGCFPAGRSGKRRCEAGNGILRIHREGV